MQYMRKIIYLNDYSSGECGANVGYAKISKKEIMSQRETWVKIEIYLKEEQNIKGEKIYLLERDKNAVNKVFFEVLNTEEKEIIVSKNIKEIGKRKGDFVGIIIGEGMDIVCGGVENSDIHIMDYVPSEIQEAIPEVMEDDKLTVEEESKESEVMGQNIEEKNEEEEEEEEIIQVEIEEAHDEAYEYRKIFANRPNMYPFEDDEMEACVQISPADFSDFPKGFWKLGSNSFLLQGYYNYRHLILGRVGNTIYVGIPGQYHRRDKYLAEMFGFGKFKGIYRRQQKLGDFGYWMMQIEIPPSTEDGFWM